MAAIAVNQPPTRATPVTRSATQALARAVAAALLLTALAILAVLVLAGRPDWWRAFMAASVVSVAAAAATVPVVAWGLRAGLKHPEILTSAYLASMLLRAVVSLGGGVAAIILGKYPLTATLMMILPYYLSILAAETIVVARLLNTRQREGEAAAEPRLGRSLAVPLGSPQQSEPPAASCPAENTHA